MSTYVIGDVQGCYDELIKLTKKVKFNPENDTLIFAGDLVNRGPKSKEVLDFCLKHRDSIKLVLGNHDLYLLSLIESKQKKAKTLTSILISKDTQNYFDWLIKHPLLLKVEIKKTQETFWISHAGIPHFWSLSKALNLSKELSKNLQSNPKSVLKNMWGDLPNKWNENLSGSRRLRLIINCFTRMRFIDEKGNLNLIAKDIKLHKNLEPWFGKALKILRNESQYIVFGHWAALNGKTNLKNIIGLDTGCVWGGKLTAIRLEDKKIFAVKKI